MKSIIPIIPQHRETCICIYIINIFVFVNLLRKMPLLYFSAMFSVMSGNAINIFFSLNKISHDSLSLKLAL